MKTEGNTYTSVRAVAKHHTVLKHAVWHRKLNPLTPFIADAWEHWLRRANLFHRYPNIVHNFRHGFDLGIPHIHTTQTPPNHPSLLLYDEEFNRVVQHEFSKARYIGPFTKAQLEVLIGPFQSSPISLIPKPHKPNAFRLVQNYSHPHVSTPEFSSINSHIDSDDYPCTWGTFNAMAQVVLQLPPGSQGAVRDVSEAYRNIPAKPEQWPGMVVRLSNDRDEYVLDMQGFFGGSANTGVFGLIADAGADIFRFCGIGPILKWVDDHVFFRILRKYLNDFNERRAENRLAIIRHEGQHKSGGRIWWGGRAQANGDVEEFTEDMVFPIKDLSHRSPRSPEEEQYTCNLNDIDEISNQLGIPWEREKDQIWSSVVTFTGFVWDLEHKTVTLTEKKRQKYLEALKDWQGSRTHNLKELQKLYGKLLHSALVIKSGRAYLTNLEKMLGTFQNEPPFKRKTPPRGTIDDILWWQHTLGNVPTPSRLRNPDSYVQLDAYSDASSGTGIGVCLGNRWRAWRLKLGWNTEGRDIGWAEAVGFEFLVYYVLQDPTLPEHAVIFGDNQGIVLG